MLLSLWMLGGAASAATQQQALDYMDAWMARSDANAELSFRYSLGLLSSQADHAQDLAQAQVEARQLVLDCEEAPRWPGGEEELSLAVCAQARHAEQWYAETLPTMLFLVGKERPRDADQVQFETLLHLSNDALAQDRDRIEAAVQSFGRAHRIEMEALWRFLPQPAPLTVALPGTPSGLSADWRINFAVGHHNEVLARHDANVALWLQGVSADEDGLGALGPSVVLAVERSKEVPAWMGDATLTQALSESAEQLLVLWERLTEAAALDARVFKMPWHNKRYSVIVSELEAGAEQVDGRMERALQDFQRDWKFQAYQEHAARLEQWAQEQQARP